MNEIGFLVFGFFLGWCVFGLLATYGEARWQLITRVTDWIIGRK